MQCLMIFMIIMVPKGAGRTSSQSITVMTLGYLLPLLSSLGDQCGTNF